MDSIASSPLATTRAYDAEHLFASKVARTCCQCNGGEQNGPWATQGSYYISNRCLSQLLLGGEELGAAHLNCQPV